MIPCDLINCDKWAAKVGNFWENGAYFPIKAAADPGIEGRESTGKAIGAVYRIRKVVPSVCQAEDNGIFFDPGQGPGRPAKTKKPNYYCHAKGKYTRTNGKHL